MKKTTFDVPKMDCPSEERMIRMALDGVSDVKKLEFDLKGRKLAVVHEGEEERVLEKLVPLGFGAKIAGSRELEEVEEVFEVETNDSNPEEQKVLKQLLAINGAMFVIELVLGIVAQSTGLLADSLDMLADAFVYGLSLYAVGKALKLKKRAARYSGYLQLALAAGAFFEVIRRFFYGSEPESALMMGVSFVALIANVSCLVLLSKHREGEVHMKASWIFSTNDVIANIGVIVAGGLVFSTNSRYPDLVVGAVIAAIVLRGAISILKISR